MPCGGISRPHLHEAAGRCCSRGSYNLSLRIQRDACWPLETITKFGTAVRTIPAALPTAHLAIALLEGDFQFVK